MSIRVRLLVLLVVLCSVTAQGATFTVRSPTDAGRDGVTFGCAPGSGLLCTLRAAVQEANDTAEADEIVLGAVVHELTKTGTEDLAAAGDLDVLQPLTITGRGSSTVIDGKTLHRVFDVRAGSLTLNEVTIRNGKVVSATLDGCAGGGGVCVASGATVTIRKGVLSANVAPQGAGIYVAGTLLLEQTTLNANVTDGLGGAIAVNTGGAATVDECAVTGNTGLTLGGGIAVYGAGATLVLRKSTVSGGNAAQGGGISLSDGGTATIANSTISGNVATQEGAGLYCDVAVDDSGPCFVANNVTIAKNAAQGTTGGGVFVAAAATAPVITNSILADNTPTDCDGLLGGDPATSVNLVESPGTCPTGAGWILESDPVLAALAANDGVTQTHALGDESPALARGSMATCEMQDQRSEPRGERTAGKCDLGAFEVALDADEDGISDAKDKCPALSTSNNADADGDGVGDACECASPDLKSVNGTSGDDDQDGVANHSDCCNGTVITNAAVLGCENQPSLVGTNGCSIEQDCACGFRLVDGPDDQDEVPWRNRNAWRKCVRKATRNLRARGIAQTCRVAVRDATLNAPSNQECGVRNRTETDVDGDEVPNGSDNCPRVFNPRQLNSDDDTENNPVRGNACDEDNDDDNLLDDDDKCPNVLSCKNEDADSDGFGNECDECPWKNTGKRIDDTGCSKNQERFGPVTPPDTCEEETPTDPDDGTDTEE